MEWNLGNQKTLIRVKGMFVPRLSITVNFVKGFPLLGDFVSFRSFDGSVVIVFVVSGFSTCLAFTKFGRSSAVKELT